MKVIRCTEIEEGVTIALDGVLIIGVKVEAEKGIEAKRAII
jgi:hypothetical protein